MKDVSTTVQAIQPLPLLVPDKTTGALIADPEMLLPGDELRNFDFHILDNSVKALEGWTYSAKKYSTAGVTSKNKQKAAGRVFVLDRERGTTRLFFVWIPNLLVSRMAAGKLPSPLNFHVLFHPPTYETEYKETPYWDGKRPSDSTAHYVKLGIRYLAQDFKAVAHHVMAVSQREPNLAYVVPVAEHQGNFDDILTPVALKTVLGELYDFVARQLNSGKAPQFDTIGKVMVSGYSRSGDRLAALMANQSGPSKTFFENNLAQVNAFDINLGNDDTERLPKFIALWQSIREWVRLNPRGRSCIYTAYRSHYNICNMTPIAPMRGWDDRTEFNLETPPWADASLKAKTGQVRGMASDQYTSDPSSGVVCLPVSFFQNYIPNNGVIVGNAERGWSDTNYGIKGAHGHGLFLRGMLSHAIAHADPLFFTQPASR
ncbi:hypothetical protein SKC41_11110 [Mycobacterium sp. 050128]|uniref:hypothetical protein n=1 Tax=Mycobacterium sp. 050128 TaxID=3096112 RepID=UPI002ED88EB4